VYSGSIPDVASNLSPLTANMWTALPVVRRGAIDAIDRTHLQGIDMADFAGARRKMVDNQLRTSNITDRRLLAAMDEVPRELFLPAERRPLAYADLAHPVGGGRAVPAPAPFAKLVQLAEVDHTDKVLVVGSATGYGAAVLARLAAQVTALESDEALAAASREALAEAGAANVTVVTGAVDGSTAVGDGYDVILIEGAVRAVPEAFFSALVDGGRLVALVQTGAAATAQVFVRSGDGVAARSEFNATLPPLPSRPSEAFVF
jgi:protein-L-isoaspartate(D-aspartate) O-methyltransferase